MNRLVLIDGNAILHRAFHALPPLITADGKMVNAVYGFASMLFKLVNDFQPTHLAVAFDRPAPTFRKKLFKAYQAKRPKMDDNLIPQVDIVHQLLRAFNISVYELDGFEADDLIGTLSKKITDKQVIIVTGDRDILQLVEDERVLVFMPTKGLSEGKLYGEKEVEERMGVGPKLIPDFKALAGDNSDNYPGVPGIGPKTAVKLLGKYKNIQNVIQTLSQKDRESAQMSYKLATINTDVPIEINLEKMQFSSLNQPVGRKILEELHFPSLIKRLDKGKKQPEKTEEKKDSEQQALF